MHAETAYLFRHALLRDAAYQLQLPGDRARLHALAFAILQSQLGALPPDDLADTTQNDEAVLPGDALALELADHAHLAAECTELSGLDWRQTERRCLRRAALHAERSFLGELAVALWLRHAELAEHGTNVASMRRAGVLALQFGRMQEALELLGRAQSEAEAAGDHKCARAALANLANIYFVMGQTEESERAYRAVLSGCTNDGEERTRAIALGGIGTVCMYSARVEEARAAFAKSLQILRSLAEQDLEAIILVNLGNLLLDANEFDQAERVYSEALAIRRKQGNLRGEGIALGNLAGLYHDQGKSVLAEPLHEQALAIHRKVGNYRSEGIVLGNIGIAFFEQGRLAEADARLGEALAIHREVGNRRSEASFGCARALVWLAQGRQADAREAWLANAAQVRAMGDSAQLAQCVSEMRRQCASAAVSPFDATE